MKIAYVILIGSNKIGVEKAIKEKANALISIGATNVDFIVLNPTRNQKDGIVKYIQYKRKIFPLTYYNRIFKRYSIIEENVNLNKYDYIILRYANADKSGIDFVNTYNIITEHHTDEISEYLSKLNTKLSNVLRINQKIRLNLERKYGAAILQGCKGLIAVTDEIRKVELNRIHSKIPSIIIPNGINVKSIKFTGFKRFDGKNLDIAIVANHLSPWHGLDRFINALNHYKNDVNILLHIIGNINMTDLKNITSNFKRIKFYGSKTGAELDDILSKMQLAISTLGLFRKKMKEACSLKTREYTARGLPFILAYNDPDLDHVNKNLKFYLLLENNDSPIDIKKVINFVYQLNNDPKMKDISNYMRQYAFEHMDWKVKMKNYLQLIDKINLYRPNNSLNNKIPYKF